MNITTHGGTTDASDKQPGVVTIGSKDLLGGWREISTAPKDGTPVLLVWHWDSGLHTGTTVIMASWTCRKHAMLSSPHRCPNEPDCNMGWDCYKGEFSHWMPLPEPPNSVYTKPH